MPESAIAVENRTCARCGSVKPETGFYRAKSGVADSQGLRRRNICKACVESQKRDRERCGISSELPAEPFIRWLESRYRIYCRDHVDGWEGFAPSVGLSARRLHDIINHKSKYVTLSTVDHSLTWEGGTFLWELYPALYPDLKRPEPAGPSGTI